MRIFDNLLYKVVSLLIACVLWAAAQGVTDVEQSLDVPVAVEKVPDSLVVVEESAHEINVRLVGSRAALRQAVKNLQHYTVSLEGAKPGEARLSVNRRSCRCRAARASRRARRRRSCTRSSPWSARRCPCAPTSRASCRAGYRLVRVSLEPKEIAIAGARSSVRNIREVVTDRIDLGRLRETAVLESSVALGYPHVWRKDPDAGPIRVSVEIEASGRRAARRVAERGASEGGDGRTARKLFGTDGIRGRANVHPMTGEVMMQLGRALALVFRLGPHGASAPRVLIGKDTRLSGYMLEDALAAGLCSMGVDVLQVGPIPTPGLAFLTVDMRCDAGAMISRVAQPVRGQRRQVLLARRLQAARRDRGAHRGADGLARARARSARSARTSAARGASTTRRGATSSS